jgi:transposase-like protein
MSEPEKITDSNRQPFWQRVMEARRESGVSVAAFCRQEGLSEGAYYYWHRKLSGGVSPSAEKSPPAFLEVVVPRDNPVALELVLSCGHTLRINPAVDPKRLSEVLSALKQVGLC